MAANRLRSGGFTLIELLVVNSIISVLIGLLIPDVRSAREAAARQVGKSALSDVLCSPPFCDDIQLGVTLGYPAVPDGLTSSSVLSSGMRITFDRARIDEQPFGVHPADADELIDPIDIAFNLNPADFDGGDFALLDVTYTGPGLDYLVRRGNDASLWLMSASVGDHTLAFTAVASPVPEPATWLLMLGALAFPAFNGLARRARTG